MADNFEITSGSGTIVATHQNNDGSHEQKIQVTNIPAVSGTVSVSNFPATQPVSAATLPLPSGASTEATLALIKAKTDNLDVALSSRTKPADTQLVDGSAHTQPVSGSVSVTNFPGTQPVSGTVAVSNFPATQPISAASLPLPSGASQEHTTAGSPHAARLTDGTSFYKSTTPSDTQPVSAASLPLPSGASTEATLALIKAKTDNLDVALSTRTKPADSQTVTGSVSVSNFPATQPVSAASLPLPSGASTSAKQPALGTAGTASADVITVQGIASMTALKVDGSAVTQPISAASLPLPSGASTEATLALIKAKTDNLDVLLSTRTKPADSQITQEDLTTGRSLVMKTGTLVTTATTADQVILTYTVTGGKTFYLVGFSYDVRLTAVAATASVLGTISLETPSGTKVFTASEVNPTTSETGTVSITSSVPLPIAAGTVIRWVTTPAATTSMTWIGNFMGYEK